MRRLGLILLGMLGCADEQLVVPLPELTGSTAALLLTRGSEVLEATIYDLEKGGIVERAEPSLDHRLVLLSYAANVEVLDVPTGPLGFGAGDGPKSLPSTPLTAHHLELSGHETSWSELPRAETLAILDEFRFVDTRAHSGCPVLKVETHNLDVVAHIIFAVRVSETAVLLGTEASKEGEPARRVDQLLLLDLQNPDAAPQPIDRPEGLPILAAHYDGQRVWFFGEQGRAWGATWTGSGLQNPENKPATSSGRTVRWVDGGPGPRPEIYALSVGNPEAPSVLERYEDSGWTRVHEFGPEATLETRQDGFLRWIEPGHVIAGSRVLPGLIRVRDGTSHIERPDGEQQSYSMGAFVDGLGFVVGAANGGEFYRWSNGVWSPLGKSAFSLSPFSATRLGDGFLAAGMQGTTSYFRDVKGFCPGNRIPRAAHTTRFLIPFENKLVGFGDVPISGYRLPISVFELAPTY